MAISKENKAIGVAVTKASEMFKKTGKEQGKSKSDKGLFNNLQKEKKLPKIANKKQP